MRIGLTGAQGVLGHRLVDALTGSENKILPFPDDVRNADAVRRWVDGLDIVVHAAAMVPVKTVNSRLDDAISVNVGGTANIAKSVAEVPGCRLVYLSTSHVYKAQVEPLSEDSPTGPTSLYGLTKLQGEAWVQALLPDHLMVRIFSFFDSRQLPPFLVPSLSQQIRGAPANASIELAGAECIRDLADGRWIAHVIAGLIENKASGTINCGTGDGHSVLDIARLLAKTHGRDDISWQPKEGTSADRVVANVDRLREMLGELPAADLSAALSGAIDEMNELEKVA